MYVFNVSIFPCAPHCGFLCANGATLFLDVLKKKLVSSVANFGMGASHSFRIMYFYSRIEDVWTAYWQGSLSRITLPRRNRIIESAKGNPYERLRLTIQGTKDQSNRLPAKGRPDCSEKNKKAVVSLFTWHSETSKLDTRLHILTFNELDVFFEPS
jgi:hypothetical protein